VPDGAVFAAGVESLEYDQQRVSFIGVKQVLELVQAGQSFLQLGSFIFLDSERVVRIAVFQPELLPGLDHTAFCDVHPSNVNQIGAAFPFETVRLTKIAALLRPTLRRPGQEEWNLFKALVIFGWTVFALEAVFMIAAMISRDMGDDAAGRGLAFGYGLIGLVFVLLGGVALFFSARAHSWLGATASILPLVLPLLLFFGTDIEYYVHRIVGSLQRQKEGRFPEPAQRELYKAILAGDYAAMRKILAAHPNLNARDEADTDLLWYAVTQTHLIRGRSGSLAEEDAENLKYVEGIRLLLEADMDPNQSKGPYGGSTFGDAGSLVSPPSGPPARAAMETFRVLLNHGANPNQLREGQPLIFSIWNNLDAMRELLDHGADINARDPSGDTALLFYLWNGRWDAAVFVLERGADIDVQNNSGMTPELALEGCRDRIVNSFKEPLPEGYNKTKAALDRRRASKGH
jgi:hypothetical protein